MIISTRMGKKMNVCKSAGFSKQIFSRFCLFVLLFFMVQSELRAQGTFTCAGTGNWGAPATWTLTSGTDGDGVPDSDDAVRISNGRTVTVNVTSASCASLDFFWVNGSSGGLTISSGNTLSVTGAVTVASESGGDGDFYAQIYGDGTLNAASITVGADFNVSNNRSSQLLIGSGNVAGTATSNPIVNISGNVTIRGYQTSTRWILAALRLISGTVTVGGVMTTTNEAAGSFSRISTEVGLNGGASAQSCTLKLTNTSPWSITTTGTSTANLNGSNSTVEYSGASQTVREAAYTNLTLSGSGTKTIGAAATISSNVTISGTAVASLNTGTTYTIGSLTLGGYGKINGTWGSTTATTATNQTNTFFAATTGRLSVTNDTRPALTVTASAQSKTYGATAPTSGTLGTNYTATGSFVGADAASGVTLGYSGSPTGNTATAAVGSYTITPSALTISGGTVVPESALSNYNITYNTGTLTVNTRALSITANDDSKTYGQTKTYGSGSTAFTSSGLQNSETIGSVTITASGGTASNAAVGTYTLTPSAPTGGTFNSGNYSITYNTGTLTVNTRALSITANDDSKTYGQTKTYGLGSTAFTSSGLQNSETIGSVTITASGGTASNAAVGTYTLTPSAPTGGTFNSGNYSITYNTGTLTVNAKGLTASLTGTVSKTYDGNTTATLTTSNYNLTGVESGDNVTVTNTSGTYDNATVGTGKTVTVTSLTLGGTSSGNYSISGNATGGVGTISKKVLTITADNQTVAFGTAAATVTGAGSYTATGFISGENASVISGSATYTTNYTNTTAAGTAGVTITPDVSGLTATNYSFTPANGTITITASAGKSWSGGTGNWSTAGNWTPSGAPASSDDVTISSGTPTMDVDYTVGSGKTLTISGSGALTIAAGKTLTVAGTANFGGSPVTLKSTSAGTAAIGQVSGSLSNATNVTVERFITARRKYRALTAPLTSSVNDGNIYANWQNNGTVSGNTGAIIWRPASTPGDEVADGFYAGGNLPSIYNYLTGTGYVAVSSTKAAGTLFDATRNNALLIYYTGPFNTLGQFIASGTAASTLSATGALRIGNVSFSGLANGWHMIGNPYASKARLNGGSNLNSGGYVWDPNMTGVGGYRAVTLSTATVESGQAFFVYTNGSGSMNFTEASKVTGSSSALFRQDEGSGGDIHIELNKKVVGVTELADVAIVNYKSGNRESLPKLHQIQENMAIYDQTQDYGISARTLANGQDVIQLRLWQMNEAAYQFNIDLRAMNLPTGTVAVLQDAFLNKETALSTTDLNKIDFNVTSNAASSGQRFRIVLRTGSTTPVTNVESGEQRFHIYPNPIEKGSNMQLEFRNKLAGKYTVTLFTIAGVRVQQDVIGHAGGTAVQSLKLSNLASGTYIAEISGMNGASEKVKVVVE